MVAGPESSHGLLPGSSETAHPQRDLWVWVVGQPSTSSSGLPWPHPSWTSALNLSCHTKRRVNNELNVGLLVRCTCAHSRQAATNVTAAINAIAVSEIRRQRDLTCKVTPNQFVGHQIVGVRLTSLHGHWITGEKLWPQETAASEPGRIMESH